MSYRDRPLLRGAQRFFSHRKEKRLCAAKGHALPYIEGNEPNVPHETLDRRQKCGSGSIPGISAFFNDAVGIDERSWGIPRLLPGASHMTWLSLPIAVASSGVILSNGVILWSTRRFVLTLLSDVPPAETAVVLGCAAKVNGGPNFYFEARMDAAAELFSCGQVERLLVSGGLGRNGSECDAMVFALIQRGVPTARIHTHTAGSRTWASVKHCATRPSTGPVVFVSQAFHLPRAVWMARRLGVTAYGYCAPSPPPRSVKHLRMHLREVASRTRAVADVAVHPHAAPLVR